MSGSGGCTWGLRRTRWATEALDGLLEEGKRGDPVAEITWSTLSLREIARQMALPGFAVSKDTVARLMREEGWSLQGMSRVLEGRQHPDRDAQFRHISAEIAEAPAAGEPVISADGKKKEQLGAYHRDGRSWRPGGTRCRSAAMTSRGRTRSRLPRTASTTSPPTGGSSPPGPAAIPARSR